MKAASIGVGAGPAGQVLAGPLLFKVKIKFHFCKKQVMNRNASVIFRLVRLIILLYNRQKKHIKRGKIIGRPRTQFIAMITKYILCTIASSKVLV